MKLAITLGAASAAVAAAVAVSPAASQPVIIPDVIGSTIGNMVASGQEHRCLSGEPPSPDAVAAARAGAQATTHAYVAAAGAGERIDATAFFSRSRRGREWVSGGVPAPVEAVADPLARAVAGGRARLGAPAAFVRSGDERTAQGLWPVEAATGDAPVIGHYLVDFRRERSGWKMTRLELFAAGDEPKSGVQYCHRPGDVEPYLAAVAEREAEQERRRAEREARRLARARR